MKEKVNYVVKFSYELISDLGEEGRIFELILFDLFSKILFYF